jgi:hypothetical protein
LDPNAEWGPSFQDIRHRANAMINVPVMFGMRASVNTNAQSAAPYNITTGRDDNLDGVVNDRPAGVTRNSARGASRWDMSLRLSRNFGFGGARNVDSGAGQGGQGQGGQRGGGGQGGGGGGGARGGGAGPGAAPQIVVRGDGPGAAPGGQGGPGGGGPGGGGVGPIGDGNQRFSVEVWISANNVLNRVNYLNFSGNLLSPFFGQPTSATQARRVEVGMNFRF